MIRLKPDEKEQIRELLKREPTSVEWQIFDVMWSEHCSYKSSKRVLKRLPTKGSEVVLGIGEDSGIIHFTEHNGKRYGLVIAHESHNHPSQILPVEGAATGVGGVVRDVYCMGADVIGVLNSLHFGLDAEQKNPLVDEIAEEVVLGVSDYANPLGVPVLGGETLYHPSYNENCLVNVAALGLVEEDKIIHSYAPQEARNEEYDVILVGKSTDATGFGGASFSSGVLDSADERTNIGAVQVHDPFLKRVIVEAIKHVLKIVHEKKIPIGFKDLGAGGIACATSELASAGGFGVDVDLSKVNLGVENLAPEIISCSETQERFCLMVPSKHSKMICDVFNETYALPSIYHNAGAVVVGQVKTDDRFRLFHQGKLVCDLPVKAITTEVRADRQSKPRPKPQQPTVKTRHASSLQKIGDYCLRLLSDPNHRSKRYVYRFFDNAVRGDAIVYPGEADAVVTAPIENCKTAVAVSIDSNLYGLADPYVSGAYAVAEGVRNVISVGAKPIAITDCLNYGNPEKPEVFFDFEEGVRGIAEAAQNLGFIDGEALPIISGNVSFYNESKSGNAVIPSPVILVAGRLEDYHRVVTMQIQNPNEKLVLVGKRYAEFDAPQMRFDEEKKANKAVFDLISNRLVSACHDISSGGFWISLCEMLLGERGLHKVGATLDGHAKDLEPETLLFSENGGYILSISEKNWGACQKKLAAHGADFWELGHTTSEPAIRFDWQGKTIFDLPLQKIKTAWNSANDR